MFETPRFNWTITTEKNTLEKPLHFCKFPERLAAEARVAVARSLSILTFKSRVHLALWNNFLSTRSLQTLNVSHKFLGNFKALNKGLSCIFIKHPFSFHSFLCRWQGKVFPPRRHAGNAFWIHTVLLSRRHGIPTWVHSNIFNSSLQI